MHGLSGAGSSKPPRKYLRRLRRSQTMSIQNRNLQGAKGSFTARVAFEQAILLYLFESPDRASRRDLAEEIDVVLARLNDTGHVATGRHKFRLNKSGKSVAGMLATSFFRQIEL